MNFSDVIKEINSDKRLKPDLLKSENGNNFRAVSESAILDVIEPVFQKYGLYYTTEIKESHLEVKEAYGKKGKKLQFIYHLVLKIYIYCYKEKFDALKIGDYENVFLCSTESVGMGIDDCDKAAGKAYTYALKYGLIKLFRLRYGDDPDHDASEPLLTAPLPADEKKSHEDKPTKKSGSKKDSKEQGMSESQRDFILGLMKQKGVRDSDVLGKFSVEPSRDEFISMKTARAIIDWLKDFDDLPF